MAGFRRIFSTVHVLFIAVLIQSVSSQTAVTNRIIIKAYPSDGAVLGEKTTLEYEAPTNDPVKIELFWDGSFNATVGSGTDGSFDWTPSTSLVAGPDYYLTFSQSISNSALGLLNWSDPFPLLRKTENGIVTSDGPTNLPSSTSSSVPSSSPTGETSSPSSDTAGKTGLSIGEKVAIGITVPIAVIILIAAAFFFGRRRAAKRKSAVAEPYTEKPELDGTAKEHDILDGREVVAWELAAQDSGRDGKARGPVSELP
ncbi:hypothetical protein P152DRAFT_469632 [Eremomyces bilateralis CBS 781.70]|uniref:Uncharacterized protein n=1 Tax=Eremomyces bilateralis CBS 781.70 TaxID=1392243 RepID=A0A6G1GH11_9PEZI|nr:uncharacterized protein P152DRAFT_469632 [Eremomyces bilateralis CBS 781.70]KAF1817159.1 hypothetical protein P152DRAFT_469632 [Eremomyces bilateralis CBS 781.70]